MFGLYSALLGAHITLGAIAVLTGTTALAVEKGGNTHTNFGRFFVITMGLSSAIGAVLGVLKLEDFYITFHAGILGFTLTISSWLSIRSSHLGLMSRVISLLNILNAAGLIAAGSHALSLPDAMLFGFHAEDYFFLSAMAGVVALGDISLIFRKPLSRKHLIARHLWRMCLGFFIAAGSAFTGPGSAVFPKAIQDSGVLAAPEVIIFVLMLFWLVRTLLQPAIPEREKRT